MDNFRIAVKAFIVKDGQLLVIKRRSNDVHKPGEWDIPGGRLEFGENPLTGVQREAREEVGMEIEVKLPIAINHFTRDDGQQITMIIFLCQPQTDEVKLSEEHTDSQWIDLRTAESDMPAWLRPVAETVLTYQLDQRLQEFDLDETV